LIFLTRLDPPKFEWQIAIFIRERQEIGKIRFPIRRTFGFRLILRNWLFRDFPA